MRPTVTRRQTATFQTQSTAARWRRVGRFLARLTYPLGGLKGDLGDLDARGRGSTMSQSRASMSTSPPMGTQTQFSGDDMTEDDGEVDMVVTEDVRRKPSVPALDEETNSPVGETSHSHSSHGMRHRPAYVTNVVSAWRRVSHWFVSDFADKQKEAVFKRESWFLSKRLALVVATFFYCMWGLLIGLLPRPWSVYDYYCYIGISGLFIVPLLPMILFDVPVRYPLFYQSILFCATYVWTFLLILQIRLCGYYEPGPQCSDRDFLGLFFYATSMPVFALLALGLNRAWVMLGSVGILVEIAVVIIVLRRGWIRYFFNYALFALFLMYISYSREAAERRIFTLRDQLSMQWKATGKAQVAEKRAQQAKSSLTSYLFHEVRNPLGTAALALQSLTGEGVFEGCREDVVELVEVMDSSLGMMEKVLNDVLDYNRMEAGKLLMARTTFDLPKVLRAIVLSGQGLATSKGLTLTGDIDPSLEHVRFVIGDDMRLRQCVANLLNNACKFTLAGGKVTLVTRLMTNNDTTKEEDLSDVTLNGTTESQATTGDMEKMMENAGEAQRRDPHRSRHSHSAAGGMHMGAMRSIRVRIEVHDTGVGIRPKDAHGSRLFSPYVQTEIGKRQGGKGTGLGLALVRNIVQLSGGTLGLRSKVGQGSCFWIEQDFPVASSSRRASVVSPAYRSTSQPRPADVQPAISTVANGSASSAPMGSTGDVMSEKGAIETSAQSVATSPPNTADATTLAVPGSPQLHARRPSLVHLHSSEMERANSSLAMATLADESPPAQEYRKTFSPADEESQLPTFTFGRPVSDLVPSRILVVDDDLLTRRLMTRMLTRLGHCVASLENGSLALHAVRKAHGTADAYDVVFLDNQMPVLTGVEAVSLMRLGGLDVFVCGVTGNAAREDQEEYLDAGADRVLTKPVREAALREVIDLAMARSATQKADAIPAAP